MGNHPWVFIVTQSPEQDRRLWEALDMALAFSAFEQPVVVLFQAQGVRNLLTADTHGADPALIGVIKSFPLYEIEWFACEQSLRDLHLGPDGLWADTPIITHEAKGQLLSAAREVLVF